MIRNVLHDHISWIAVYALAFVVTVLAIYSSGFSPISLGADASSLSVGVNKMLLLVPGAFYTLISSRYWIITMTMPMALTRWIYAGHS